MFQGQNTQEIHGHLLPEVKIQLNFLQQMVVKTYLILIQ